MAALIPIAYLCTSVFMGALALRASQKDTLGLIGLSVSLALLAFRRVTNITTWAEMSSLLGFFTLLWIFHIVKLLALDKAIPPSDWRKTYKALFDFRKISAEKQGAKALRDIPDINTTASSERKENRTFTSSSKRSHHRTIFLLKRLLSVITILLLNHIYTKTYPLLLHLSYTDFHPQKQTYIRRIPSITARETAIRSWLVIHFVWSSYCTFTATHDILAIAHVLLGIDEPEEWPRLYGSVIEAYSMRRFWGKFWHRLVQRSYEAYGSLLSRKVLGLLPGSFADRSCVNFSVFLISGIVHALITVQLGFACGYWEDLAFFVICYAAVLVEEGVQLAASRTFIGRGEWQDGWICRGLGYLWVFGFLFWVLPKHQYPKVLCTPA